MNSQSAPPLSKWARANGDIYVTSTSSGFEAMEPFRAAAGCQRSCVTFNSFYSIQSSRSKSKLYLKTPHLKQLYIWPFYIKRSKKSYCYDGHLFQILKVLYPIYSHITRVRRIKLWKTEIANWRNSNEPFKIYKVNWIAVVLLRNWMGHNSICQRN